MRSATPGAPTPGAPTPGAPTPGAPTPGAPTPGASTPGVPGRPTRTGPTPATLPRPRRAGAAEQAQAHSPADAHSASAADLTRVAPPTGPHVGAVTSTDPGTESGTETSTGANQSEGGVAGALEATRRMIPTPATLMAAGRGIRKVRSTALRGRRLPKVEETSAGGVVLDLTSDPPAVALIARHDRRSRLLWSLPKGHVEAGETPEMAALREVHEETGLVGRILAPLGIIDFWFVVEDRRIHKTVHHYVIEAVGGELSDEDIEVEAVEWIPFNQVVRKLAYGDERRLVEKVAQIVPGVK